MASGIVEPQGSETSLQTQQGAAPGRLLQRLLGASENLPQFIEELLRTQAAVVAGTEAAGFLIEKTDQAEASLRLIAHIRPDNSSAETRAAAIAAFQEIIKPCLAQGKDGAIEIQTGDATAEPQFCLVTLLRREADVVAVSAVITRCRNIERAQQRLMSMQLVAGYFDLYTLRRAAEQSQTVAQSHQHVLQLATAVATAEGFESAAMNLCNELATRTGATRVALGWIKSRDVRVKALSHTEQFDKKMELVKLLEKSMEECIDQEEPVHYDPQGGGTENVSRSAQALSRSEGGNIVLTLPLRRRAEVVGAVTLEFPLTHRLSPQALTGLSVAVDLLAPQLFDRFQNDRWLITKMGLSAEELAKKAVGPQYTLAKVLTVLALAALVFICVYSPMYHVSAPFQFGAVDKRKLEVPFDGQIKDVLVLPGDKVKQGQLLLTMDTHDLELKRNEANSEADKAHFEYLKARDDGKLAEADIAEAQMKAAQADSDWYQQQINRGQIKAPFDGVVLSGDLSDQRNVTKKEGDELFVVAADTGLRAEISASESDIQDLAVSQRGTLSTKALPTQKYGFTVDRIVPLGETKEGDNTFSVYGKLDQNLPTWKPGMEGEVRVNIKPRPVIWIWTHKFVNFVRLKLWL